MSYGIDSNLLNILGTPDVQNGPMNAQRKPRAATVLIADGRAEDRQLLRAALEDMGHAVVEASNGQQALTEVRKAKPDLILSEITMPGVDGFKFCRRLQEDPELRHVPFAFVTASYTERQYQQFARDVGAVRVLRKPIEPQELRAAVQDLLLIDFVPGATQTLRRLDNATFHERHAAALGSQLERKVAELERLTRLYKVLSHTNQAIVRTSSREQLFPAMCRIAVEHGGARLAAIVLADQAGRRPARVASYNGVLGSRNDLLVTLDELNVAGRGLSVEALRTGVPVISNNVLNDPITKPWHEAARRAGVGSVAVYPFTQGGIVVGALELYAGEPGFFTAEMLPTLEEMTTDISFALDNYARQAEHSRAVQATADALEYNHLLLASSPVGIITYKETGAAVSANPAAATLVGGTVEQLKAQNFREIESWKRSGLLRLAEQVLSTETSLERDIRISTTFGKNVWFTARFLPFSYNSEQHLLAMFSDITERKQAEEALAEAVTKYRALVEQQSLVGIYLVDEERIHYVNPRTDEIFGYESGELVGHAMKEFVADDDWPATELELRRIFSGEIPFLKLDFRGRRKDGREVLLNAHGTLASSGGRPILIGMLQDVTEQRRSEEQIRHHVEQLEAAVMQTVELATSISGMRDPYTAGHERRVAEIAIAIGKELGFDERRQQGLRVAGYLHDIGKITIPSEILSKPGRLSAAEMSLVKGHPQASYDVLKCVEFPWPVAQAALQHHERMDGSGYPQGLKGEAILFEARILAVADVIEAMASHRPYRPGLGIDKALAEIERGRGTAYDPLVVDACLTLFRQQGYRVPNS